jgi:hypothetical protein
MTNGYYIMVYGKLTQTTDTYTLLSETIMCSNVYCYYRCEYKHSEMTKNILPIMIEMVYDVKK